MPSTTKNLGHHEFSSAEQPPEAEGNPIDSRQMADKTSPSSDESIPPAFANKAGI
jgi:hypothetical protein